MNRNIATSKKEIEELKREIAEFVEPRAKKIRELDEFIRERCNHPEEMLLVDTITDEDEYGTLMTGSSRYIVQCTICGKKSAMLRVEFHQRGFAHFGKVLDDE